MEEKIYLKIVSCDNTHVDLKIQRESRIETYRVPIGGEIEITVFAQTSILVDTSYFVERKDK